MTQSFELEHRNFFFWMGVSLLLGTVLSLLLLHDGPPAQTSKFAWMVVGALCFGVYFVVAGQFLNCIEITPEFVAFEPIGVKIAISDIDEITEVIQPYDYVSAIELKTRLNKRIWLPMLFLNTKGKALLHLRHADGDAVLAALENALKKRSVQP